MILDVMFQGSERCDTGREDELRYLRGPSTFKALFAAGALLAVGFAACSNPVGPDPEPTPGGMVIAWFNGLGASVDLYFPESDSLLGGAYMTGEFPNDILSPGNGVMAVLSSGSADIRVFDLDISGTESYRVDLPTGSNPYLMALDGTDIWVTLLMTAQVAKVDLQGRGDVTLFDVPSNPSGITCAAGRVFVGHGNYPDTTVTGGITVLDASTGAQTGSIPTPDNVTSLTYFQETGKVHAVTTTYVGDGTISIVDPATSQVTAQAPVGGAPGVPVLAGGVFACGDGFFSDDIIVYNESGSLVSTWSTGVNPGGLAVSGDTMYIADFGADMVYLAEWNTRTIIDSLAAGDGPQGIAVVDR